MSDRRRKNLARAVLPFLLIVPCSFPAAAQQPDPAASRPPARMMAHYMPWYEARPRSPAWGWHWTMNTFDPAGKKTGRPDIASHYHPLIGPYDSGDPDIVEYHALLMRLAGIDGVIFDWYGTVELFDYALIHRNASAFVDQAAKCGLTFAVCYEDQTISKLAERGLLRQGDRVIHARGELEWLRSHWFVRPSYLRLDGKPVLLSFGHGGLTDNEWLQALDQGKDAPLYLSEHERSRAAAGAFDWPKPKAGLKGQQDFLKIASQWPAAMAVAFPRFHDIYEEAGIHPSWGRIDDDKGKIFETTLENACRSRLPLIQLCTWNDWGEGTVIEPSVEFGYRDLEVIQQYRRKYIEPTFGCQPGDLRLAHRLYALRKTVAKGTHNDQELNRAAQLLGKLSTKQARERLEAVAVAPRPSP
jgi:hypothetical protein